MIFKEGLSDVWEGFFPFLTTSSFPLVLPFSISTSKFFYYKKEGNPLTRKNETDFQSFCSVFRKGSGGVFSPLLKVTSKNDGGSTLSSLSCCIVR